ncbi:hypothetical protein ASG22_15930 [Chryseobacterium sp. Leaf405]|nr:hypothetical protein ASG22_15930 [Chryseobacterium sp. Leaf405]
MQNTNKIDWQKVYSNYSPKLLGICRRYIQDIYTAEDIVQDSFITAIQKNHQLNDEKALFAWLKKIVVNNALQHIRSNSKDIFVTTESSEIPDTFSEMEHQTFEEKNVFIYDFTNEELLSSIDSLPPHHKSVFNLYFIENHSHAEISNLLGITVNTSKSHLLRAKKAIQNYLLSNIINQNTPKKKAAQLLVIFGFGGLLWAQTFQSKFSDFSITPSKNLEIPSDIKVGNPSFSTSNPVWKKNAIVGITFLIIIVLSVFLVNPKNSFSTINPSKISTESIENNEDRISGNQTHENKETSDSDLQNISSDFHSDQTNNNAKMISQKPNIEEEKSIKTRKNTRKIILKDSINDVPEKVIIVKKIIKRDTVFIER